ncbi:unnamed protein product, partial [Prorocentrum cordatum]
MVMGGLVPSMWEIPMEDDVDAPLQDVPARRLWSPPAEQQAPEPSPAPEASPPVAAIAVVSAPSAPASAPPPGRFQRKVASAPSHKRRPPPLTCLEAGSPALQPQTAAALPSFAATWHGSTAAPTQPQTAPAATCMHSPTAS